MTVDDLTQAYLAKARIREAGVVLDVVRKSLEGEGWPVEGGTVRGPGCVRGLGSVFGPVRGSWVAAAQARF